MKTPSDAVDPFGATLEENPLSSWFSFNNNRNLKDENAEETNKGEEKEGKKSITFPIVPSEADLGALVMAYQNDLQSFQGEKEMLLEETEQLEEELRYWQDQLVRTTTTGTTGRTTGFGSDSISSLSELQQSKQELLEFAFLQGSFATAPVVSLDSQQQQQQHKQQLLLTQYQQNQTTLVAEQERLTNQLEKLNAFAYSQKIDLETSTAETQALREQLAEVTKQVTTKLQAVQQEQEQIQAQFVQQIADQNETIVALNNAKQALVEQAILSGDYSTIPGTTPNEMIKEVRTLRQERELLHQRLTTSERMVRTVQQKLFVIQELYDQELETRQSLERMLAEQDRWRTLQQAQHKNETKAWKTERSELMATIAQLQRDQQKLHQQWSDLRTELLREKVAVDSYRQEVETLRETKQRLMESLILHNHNVVSDRQLAVTCEDPVRSPQQEGAG